MGQGLTNFPASSLGAVDLRFGEVSSFFRSTLGVFPGVPSVVRVILYRRVFFPYFPVFFSKYWNVNELDILVLENFMKSDRTPPYIDTYLQ